MKPWSFFPTKDLEVSKQITTSKYKEIKIDLKTLSIAASCGVLGMNELIKSSFYPEAKGEINYLIDYSFHFSEWYDLLYKNKGFKLDLDFGVNEDKQLMSVSVAVIAEADNVALPSYDEVYNENDIVRNLSYDYSKMKSAISLGLCILLSKNPDLKLDLGIDNLEKVKIIDDFYEELITDPSLGNDSESEMTLGFLLTNMIRDIRLDIENQTCIIEMYDVNHSEKTVVNKVTTNKTKTSKLD
jgi:hypothetical protein